MKWMLEQIGPKAFIEQLKNEAPRYAKLLPELPRLLVDFLKQGAGDRKGATEAGGSPDSGRYHLRLSLGAGSRT